MTMRFLSPRKRLPQKTRGNRSTTGSSHNNINITRTRRRNRRLHLLLQGVLVVVVVSAGVLLVQQQQQQQQQRTFWKSWTYGDATLILPPSSSSSSSSSRTDDKEFIIAPQQPSRATTQVTQPQPQLQNTNMIDEEDPDKHCIFRNSPLYRKVYVYPTPGTPSFDRLRAASPNTSTSTSTTPPPFWWTQVQDKCRRQQQCGYDLNSPLMQYNTELLVELLMRHPESCLTTDNPEEATLFYVPYLPAQEFHNGTRILGDYATSPYGQAILDILEQENYQKWHDYFGVTSKYWKRNRGADHILVFSEPLHGLFHPKNRRGNYHFVHTQKQLTPPIVISVELSTTFVQTYPACARKNILLPYPNTDGRWFNGKLDQQAMDNAIDFDPMAQLPAERDLVVTTTTTNHNNNKSNHTTELFRLQSKPLAQYYKAGPHGTCATHRRALTQDHACTPSGQMMTRHKLPYSIGYRQASFCPCPGGDSPSAKRMFDALHGGCIPIILSHDFVWPFTSEWDTKHNTTTTTAAASPFMLTPDDFSIRLDASQYKISRYNQTSSSSCQLINPNDKGLQSVVEALTPTQIQNLRKGAVAAADRYSWYRRRPDLPDNPLHLNVLPDGGLAHALVQALAERQDGAFWPACEKELAQLPPNHEDARQFKC